MEQVQAPLNSKPASQSTPKRAAASSSQPSSQASAKQEPQQPVDHNNDICTNCGLGGMLVCCETCPASFHPLCCEPPLHPLELPDTDFFCTSCLQKKSGVPPPTDGNPFHALVAVFAQTNPKAFCLPPSLKVAPEQLVVPIAMPATANAAASAANKRRREKAAETDEQVAKSTRCLVCAQSNPGKVSVTCCKCFTLYHLECLTPPLSGVPFSASTWICPQHMEYDGYKGRPRPTDAIPANLLTPESIQLSFVKKINKERLNQSLSNLKTRANITPLQPIPADFAQTCDLEQLDDNEKDDVIRTLRSLLASSKQTASLLYEPDNQSKAGAPQENGHALMACESSNGESHQEFEEEAQVPANTIATLRATESGEVFFIRKEAFVMGRTDQVDLDLTRLRPPTQVIDRHAVIFARTSTDGSRELEILNYGPEPIYVDGVESKSEDSAALVLQDRSVLEVAGLKFVLLMS